MSWFIRLTMYCLSFVYGPISVLSCCPNLCRNSGQLRPSSGQVGNEFDRRWLVQVDVLAKLCRCPPKVAPDRSKHGRTRSNCGTTQPNLPQSVKLELLVLILSRSCGIMSLILSKLGGEFGRTRAKCGSISTDSGWCWSMVSPDCADARPEMPHVGPNMAELDESRPHSVKHELFDLLFRRTCGMFILILAVVPNPGDHSSQYANDCFAYSSLVMLMMMTIDICVRPMRLMSPLSLMSLISLMSRMSTMSLMSIANSIILMSGINLKRLMGLMSRMSRMGLVRPLPLASSVSLMCCMFHVSYEYDEYVKYGESDEHNT